MVEKESVSWRGGVRFKARWRGEHYPAAPLDY